MDWLDDFWFNNINPIVQSIHAFLAQNFYLILATACFLSALLYLVYFKPHRAAKFFAQYKNNDISRQQAITKIADTLYKPRVGVPSVINSKLTEKRVNALRKRIRAEEGFIRDLISYIRVKESK